MQIWAQWGLSVQLIGAELNMTKETVWQILAVDLEKRKTFSMMVPQILTDEQKG